MPTNDLALQSFKLGSTLAYATPISSHDRTIKMRTKQMTP
ncbi:hypothetical protein N507_0630 [Lacticaseibacillus rhamnosus DSM 14870]|nr:hypothetical protein N507_0630 [Lacticaseibacillus rhamnosus DSM 14870]